MSGLFIFSKERIAVAVGPKLSCVSDSSVDYDTHKAASSESVGVWPDLDICIINQLRKTPFSQCGLQAAGIQSPGVLI